MSKIDYIILFSNDNFVWYSFFLKKGYKHCLIIVRRRGGWRFLNPLRSGLIRADIEDVSPMDLIKIYSSMGYRVISGPKLVSNKNRRANKNCVTACKKIIGIDGFFIQTPYQLYKKLDRMDGCKTYE